MCTTQNRVRDKIEVRPSCHEYASCQLACVNLPLKNLHSWAIEFHGVRQVELYCIGKYVEALWLNDPREKFDGIIAVVKDTYDDDDDDDYVVVMMMGV